MRNHFFHPVHLKSDLDEIFNVMIQTGEWTWETIFCLLNVLKCDLGDVNEAMFNDAEKPIERIFYIFGI
jgi:hypothetical protein